jgi:hypothetical protein
MTSEVMVPINPKRTLFLLAMSFFASVDLIPNSMQEDPKLQEGEK